ncbi:MAG: hypothetical protein AAF799_15060 [Myxococcota bacterium]
MFLFRRRSPKGPPAKKDEQPDVEIETMIFIPPQPDPLPLPNLGGTPGQQCESPEGEAVWDENGLCKVFWYFDHTDDAIRSLAREQWEGLGSPGFSDLCLTSPDPLGGELAPPVDNPRFVEIVVTALERYYGVVNLWPPVEATITGDPHSPHWVRKAWAEANRVVREELCSG